MPDKDGGEEDKKDEAIVPTDLNIITDDDLRAIFEKIPEGVKFTMVSDCCHSGSMLDHPEQQISGDKAGAPAGVAAETPPDALEAFFSGVKVRPPQHAQRAAWPVSVWWPSGPCRANGPAASSSHHGCYFPPPLMPQTLPPASGGVPL